MKKTIGLCATILIASGVVMAASSEKVNKSQNERTSESEKDIIAELGGGVELHMIWIPAGNFTMGSDQHSSGERPVHPVTISEPFWIAKNEVTVGGYQQFLKASGYDGRQDANRDYLKSTRGNPNKLISHAEYPISWVSWKNALKFCEWLTARELGAGRLPKGFEYTLPTEAQWEYSCRAGTTGDYAGELDSMAWYAPNSGGSTHPVGLKQPNAWGLFDMHGNAWEWCLDDWHESYQGAPSDGSRWGDESGVFRILRGGGWSVRASRCRSASRGDDSPDNTRDYNSFRPVIHRK